MVRKIAQHAPAVAHGTRSPTACNQPMLADDELAIVVTVAYSD
jgi:hypothetical protein